MSSLGPPTGAELADSDARSRHALLRAENVAIDTTPPADGDGIGASGWTDPLRDVDHDHRGCQDE